MKIRLMKKGGYLLPFDEESMSIIKRWKENDFLTVDVKRPRNNKFHAKFFAMLNIVFQNQDELKTLDNLLNYIKIVTGECDIIESNGMAFRIPRSISFGSMDEDSFSEFYNNAVDECLKLVPMDREDLAEQIGRF